ncbi:MAG: ATP-dependent Clp protease proteolytic subunit [Chitinophagales bacterium]
MLQPICAGMAASQLFSSVQERKKTQRFDHARVIHQPMGGAQGQASDMEISLGSPRLQKRKLYTIISNHSVGFR